MRMKKTFDDRIRELNSSLQLIYRCVEHFHETREDFYLVAVLSQLRALVSYNAKRPRGSLKPLLLDLADEYGFALELYSAPPKPEHGPLGLASAMLVTKTWSTRPKEGYQCYALREWVDTRAYHLDTKNIFINRNDIIRELTEKSAVHYDEDVGELTDAMRRRLGSNYSGVQFFIVDTALAVFYCGGKFLRTRDLELQGEEIATNPSLMTFDEQFDSLRISMM